MLSSSTILWHEDIHILVKQRKLKMLIREKQHHQIQHLFQKQQEKNTSEKIQVKK